jgi:hypothetical protein
MRPLALLLAAVLSFGAVPSRAAQNQMAQNQTAQNQTPGLADTAADSWRSLQQSGAVLESWAEKAIVLGGILVYRNRHTIAGAGLGCAAGAMLGMTSVAAAGAVTGGAALAGTPQAVALGCGAGAAAGAALGYPMDHLFE